MTQSKIKQCRWILLRLLFISGLFVYVYFAESHQRIESHQCFTHTVPIHLRLSKGFFLQRNHQSALSQKSKAEKAKRENPLFNSDVAEFHFLLLIAEQQVFTILHYIIPIRTSVQAGLVARFRKNIPHTSSDDIPIV